MMIQVSGFYENGQITLLSPIFSPKAKVMVTFLEEDESREVNKRIPGLHRGPYYMADDFDAPLPDTFWLGEQ
jgi:hypothetical protein